MWAEKGGVGKTTFAVNTAAAIAKRGHSVLAIDLDHQNASMTEWLGYGDIVDSTWEEDNTAECLVKREAGFEPIIHKTNESFIDGHLDLVPSHTDLSRFDELVAGKSNPLFFVREEVKKLSSKYDYFVVDAPASRGKLSDNAIISTRNIIVPMPMGHVGVQSIRGIEKTIRTMESGLNRGPFDVNLNILGVVPNRVNDSNLEEKGQEKLSQSDTLFIPIEVRERNVLEKAWANHVSVFSMVDSMRDYEKDVIEQFDKLGQFVTGDWIPSTENKIVTND
jgi:chromosome partitioning protein